MSTPIKPPGGPPGAPPPDQGPDKAGDAGEGFRDALAEASGVGESGAAPDVAEAVASRAVQAIADDLAAGRLDGAGTVEALVQRALASGAAASLTPERREALEAFLRQSLADDPSLAALAEELDGG